MRVWSLWTDGRRNSSSGPPVPGRPLRSHNHNHLHSSKSCELAKRGSTRGETAYHVPMQGAEVYCIAMALRASCPAYSQESRCWHLRKTARHRQGHKIVWKREVRARTSHQLGLPAEASSPSRHLWRLFPIDTALGSAQIFFERSHSLPSSLLSRFTRFTPSLDPWPVVGCLTPSCGHPKKWCWQQVSLLHSDRCGVPAIKPCTRSKESSRRP